MPASSSQSSARSRRTPSQPRWPTYGGTKNRSGSASTSSRCMPSGAAHQIAKRPSPWWFVTTITNARLPRTKNVGAPWLRRSLVSGSARQSSRIRPSVRSRSAAPTIGRIVARYARAVRAWRAEVVVDADLARKLLAQFPELTVQTLRPLAEGWDRTVWLVNEQWVFGFPRRAMVVPGVELELAALPRLAPLLPLPIPTPVSFGRPRDGYPWPFFGASFLP